jgi:CRISPR-associated DxTHG motif protein
MYLYRYIHFGNQVAILRGHSSTNHKHQRIQIQNSWLYNRRTHAAHNIKMYRSIKLWNQKLRVIIHYVWNCHYKQICHITHSINYIQTVFHDSNLTFKTYNSFLKNVKLVNGHVYKHVVHLRRCRPVAWYITCPATTVTIFSKSLKNSDSNLPYHIFLMVHSVQLSINSK